MGVASASVKTEALSFLEPPASSPQEATATVCWGVLGALPHEQAASSWAHTEVPAGGACSCEQQPEVVVFGFISEAPAAGLCSREQQPHGQVKQAKTPVEEKVTIAAKSTTLDLIIQGLICLPNILSPYSLSIWNSGN
jgi:hypothetical protein